MLKSKLNIYHTHNIVYIENCRITFLLWMCKCLCEYVMWISFVQFSITERLLRSFNWQQQACTHTIYIHHIVNAGCWNIISFFFTFVMHETHISLLDESKHQNSFTTVCLYSSRVCVPVVTIHPFPTSSLNTLHQFNYSCKQWKNKYDEIKTIYI